MPFGPDDGEITTTSDTRRVFRSRLACKACRRQVRCKDTSGHTLMICEQEENEMVRIQSGLPTHGYDMLMGQSDRSLPACKLCTRLRDDCIYPTLRMKPGPKTGQLQDDPMVSEICSENPLRSPAGQIPSVRTFSQPSPGGISFDMTDRRFNPSVQATPSPPGGDLDIESNFVKAIGLSSLIHPTHDRRQSDVLSMDKDTSSTSLLNLASAQNLMADACDVFGLSLPGFEYIHRQALFAAMFSHSARFRSEDSHLHHKSDSIRFHNQALDLIYESLDEASDEQPSLCLLQAMVLVTFYELTKGVKGRAWRLLGSCVRVAYELHLHLIDYEALEENYKVGRGLSRWIEEEEGRRCWWAIWKMDVFASVIRRLPTAIDWNMIDTYLPASDEHWFSNQYCRSCFLERDPLARPKALKDCGNENPEAWLIVITSIQKEETRRLIATTITGTRFAVHHCRYASVS
ncbi:Fungal specific transcription factor [Penicillium sp. IBT 35674x]|nr:Fungal specific transcription factor [Penicillium sp. IBT 35674x]